ncbi:MAG: SDR family oxidoreductase [Actinomycetota bacterium]|nr:SDR family oxidoreductase [Actinomycetota bacterium]
MKVIVFGATGKTGQHVLRAALAAGHEVTAFGRSVDRIDIDDPALEIHKGDVFDTDSVTGAVAGHDAVIVCLGSTGLRDKTTLATGTAAVVDAMAAHDVQRLVVMSAAGVGDSWQQIPRSSRLLFRTMLRNVFNDHQAQEAIVEQSPLDWTIVRAAVLKDDPATGHYTATNTGPNTRINRADIAAALVDQLDDTTYRRTAISVTN